MGSCQNQSRKNDAFLTIDFRIALAYIDFELRVIETRENELTTVQLELHKLMTFLLLDRTLVLERDNKPQVTRYVLFSYLFIADVSPIRLVRLYDAI